MSAARPAIGATIGKALLFGGAFLVLVGLIILSGVANISVWWATGEGWRQYWYTGVGLACEIWAALGLVIITSRFVRGEWFRGAIAVGLWIPAVAFNAYTVHRFLETDGDTAAIAAVQSQANRQLIETEVGDLERRITAANVTRSVAAIEAELALVPDSRLTQRRALTEELQRARDVDGWSRDLSTKRQTLASTAAVTVDTKADKFSGDYILAGMAIWIEAMKALCLFVLRGRVREKPAPADARQPQPQSANDDSAPIDTSAALETEPQHDSSAPVIPLEPKRRRKAAAKPAAVALPRQPRPVKPQTGEGFERLRRYYADNES